MKKNYLLIAGASICLITNAQTPNFLWAKRIGGTNNDQGLSIAVYASGNVYTTGAFTGTVDFDPGAGVFNLTSAGNNDLFISKLDASGNFVWAKRMGAAGNDISKSIALDDFANVYTTGSFGGTVDFDPGAGVFNLTSAGNNDFYISKLDSAGNFVWAKQTGGTNADNGLCIALDDSGNVYTTGSFQGTVDFDPGAGIFNLTSTGNNDIFISKLDGSGNFVWAKALGGISNDVGYSITADKTGSGAVYITGSFSDTADFDPGAGTFNLVSLQQGPDIFISKLDSSGNFEWAKAMGGTSSDAGYSIAIDASGNVYTTGFFYGTADFDPGTGTFNLTTAGNGDIFISKLDSSGNFAWAKRMGAADYDYGNSIALDAAADVYTTGTFLGTVDFDPGAGTFNLTSAGGIDIFICKLDSSGNFAWAKKAGAINDDEGHSIALDAFGSVHVAGHFNSTAISFDTTVLTNADNTGFTTDVFIAKLDTTIITETNDVENFSTGIFLFPNPFSNSTTISFFLSRSQKVSLRIFDLNGRLVTTLADKIFDAGENELVWNASEMNTGIYFLQLQSTENLKMEKLIVTK
jgi:Secretion system C-terminal sorting domain/Beta-propeller repeat